MTTDVDPNIVIETSGLTAAVATDVVKFNGITAHFQILKIAHGVCGSASIVSSSSPLPVTIAGGITASLSGYTGTMNIQGVVSGTPVPVSGTVLVGGITASPVYVKTYTGTQVEVTGGRYISKSTDSISVYGPQGSTYLYASLVDSTGKTLSVTNGVLNVNVSGATINATIPSTVTVVGLYGATAVNVSIGNTANINDTNILAGMTAVYNQIVGLRSDMAGFAVTRPSGACAGRISSTTTAAQFGGYTCSEGINLKASSSNTDIIYISDAVNAPSGSTTTYGFELDPGESLFINVSNTNKITYRSKSTTQILSFIAS